MHRTRIPAEVWKRLSLVQGDITRLEVDAIVNAANERLAGGGGVDGAIHRAAGPELLRACALLGGCNPGDAKITPGFNLPARYVIHTVGPVYQGGHKGEPGTLASCYRRTLELAVERGLRSLAFPAISTGIYGYPFEEASRIAFHTVAEGLSGPARAVSTVCFVFFGARDFDSAQHLARGLQEEGGGP